MPPRDGSFGVHSGSFSLPQKLIISSDEHRHLSLSLRMRKNDAVTVFDTTNQIKLHGIIKEIEKESTSIELLSYSYLNRTPISLLLALSEPKVIEAVCEKCTELGINNILLFEAERTNHKNIKLPRLYKIRDSALKQSKSYIYTNISLLSSLEEAVVKLCPCEQDLNICFTPQRDSFPTTALNLLFRQNSNARNIAYVIGPEGGLTESELKMLHTKNFFLSSLGNNILRVETAALLGGGLILQSISEILEGS